MLLSIENLLRFFFNQLHVHFILLTNPTIGLSSTVLYPNNQMPITK